MVAAAQRLLSGRTLYSTYTFCAGCFVWIEGNSHCDYIETIMLMKSFASIGASSRLRSGVINFVVTLSAAVVIVAAEVVGNQC